MRFKRIFIVRHIFSLSNNASRIRIDCVCVCAAVIVDSQIQKYGCSHNEPHRSEQEIK